MPNVMAAQPNIGSAICKTSVIRFLVPSRKVWLTPANIGNAKLGRNEHIGPGKISLRGKNSKNCIYIVAVQETTKHRAKFGWPPVSDVAAVTKPRRESPWNFFLKFASYGNVAVIVAAINWTRMLFMKRELQTHATKSARKYSFWIQCPQSLSFIPSEEI